MAICLKQSINHTVVWAMKWGPVLQYPVYNSFTENPLKIGVLIPDLM